MKNYKWEKQQINGKWYTVCISHEHMPMIEHCKNGYFERYPTLKTWDILHYLQAES